MSYIVGEFKDIYCWLEDEGDGFDDDNSIFWEFRNWVWERERGCMF